MSVLLIIGPKCTMAASHAAPWCVTVSMSTGQTDRRTDERRQTVKSRFLLGAANVIKKLLLTDRVADNGGDDGDDDDNDDDVADAGDVGGAAERQRQWLYITCTLSDAAAR